MEEPPAILRDGGLIRDGHDPALDEFRAASRDGKDWIADLQEHEIARTGIKSLKVRFNSVFGYFIEITRANLSSQTPHCVRKQTEHSASALSPPAQGDEKNLIRRKRKPANRNFQGLRRRTLADISSICHRRHRRTGRSLLAGRDRARHNFVARGGRFGVAEITEAGIRC